MAESAFELRTPSRWLGLPSGFTVDEDAHDEIFRVKQVHGARVVEARRATTGTEADGVFLSQESGSPHLRIGVGVADCTALLISGRCSGFGEERWNELRRFIAALHAGWRGTAAGIIPQFFSALQSAENLRVWLSPSICQNHFQVGAEVRDAFPPAAASCFVADPKDSTKFLFDLKTFQRSQLQDRNVAVAWSSLCTYCQPEFFSFRRETHEFQRTGQSSRRKRRHIAWLGLS